MRNESCPTPALRVKSRGIHLALLTIRTPGLCVHLRHEALHLHSNIPSRVLISYFPGETPEV